MAFIMMIFSGLVIGFTETPYTVSENEGTATITVEILAGTVGDEDITVQFSTQDYFAIRMLIFVTALL